MHSLIQEVLWDEGLASYLKGEYDRRQIPLTTTDLQQLANARAVRITDLLETLYLLAIDGVWHYCDPQGGSRELDEEALDELYAKGRIGQDDLEDFNGVWIPSIR